MKRKFLNIEFLRFLFILSILMCHFNHGIINIFNGKIELYEIIQENTRWADIAVEFFFIISGFFMFLNIDKTMDTIYFIKKKLFRFMPTVIFILILTSFVSNYNFFDYIFTLLNIENVGLTLSNGPIPAAWFVSALFWTQLFYFYLYKITDKKWFNLFTACIVFIGYSFFLHNNDINYKNIAIVFNVGVIRAFAGIGLGYFISMWYKEYGEKLRSQAPNFFTKLTFSILETYTLILLVKYLAFFNTSYGNKLIMIIGFAIITVLFLLKKGIISQLFENKISQYW